MEVSGALAAAAKTAERPPPIEAPRRKSTRATSRAPCLAADASGVTAHTHLLSQPVAKTIAELARELQADCIVVGTHGHTGLKHALLGSVAENIIRHAPCDVWVVRGQAGSPGESAAPSRGEWGR